MTETTETTTTEGKSVVTEQTVAQDSGELVALAVALAMHAGCTLDQLLFVVACCWSRRLEKMDPAKWRGEDWPAALRAGVRLAREFNSPLPAYLRLELSELEAELQVLWKQEEAADLLRSKLPDVPPTPAAPAAPAAPPPPSVGSGILPPSNTPPLPEPGEELLNPSPPWAAVAPVRAGLGPLAGEP